MNIEKSLIDAGFQEASAEEIRTIVMSVQGREKSGKTHFSLTAPGPIAYINLDKGEKGVVNKFRRQGKEIVEVKVKNSAVLQMGPQGPTVTDANLAKNEWKKLRNAYTAALRSKSMRTVVIDTATEAWDLLRLASFGKLTQVLPFQYRIPNSEFTYLFREEALDSDKNVVLVHKVKKEYKRDEWTGDYERAGFSDMGYIMQVNAEVGFDRKHKEFWCEIVDCRMNMGLTGTRLEGPMCEFPFLAKEVFPDSDFSEWE